MAYFVAKLVQNVCEKRENFEDYYSPEFQFSNLIVFRQYK